MLNSTLHTEQRALLGTYKISIDEKIKVLILSDQKKQTFFLHLDKTDNENLSCSMNRPFS
jgi:hypothetical protein